MVKVGQKVRFDPFRTLQGFASRDVKGKEREGTVVLVNEPCRWIGVEFGTPTQRISFKFCDIGEVVEICG